jgi:UDP-N-acetylmuramoylalanine--D-glutamate ligase
VRLAELRGRRVALLGLGADVLAAVPAIVAAGPLEVVAVDDARSGSALPPGVQGLVSLADAASGAEVFVRSPGFPRYQPELAAACRAGAAMTTPLDLWLGTHGADRTVIGITGTKGKSTVASLLGALAVGEGLRVGVAGNLGVPVFDPGWDGGAPLIVLEVSSYQAADLHHVPDVAVVTFLSEDHLSWHGGVEQYVADKLRLVRNEGGTAGRVLVPAAGGGAAEAVAALGVEADVVGAPTGAPGAVPLHRLANAALAAAALAAAGGPVLDDAVVIDAARGSLPGRLDVCPGPVGVLCIDDALASNPSATAAGLAWLRSLGHPTVVILGGGDRGVDPAPLVEEAGRWNPGRLRVVAVPENGVALAEACSLPVVAEAVDVDDAVRRVRPLLGAGDALLFSPAGPTPPGLGNWATRSDAFRAALLRP